MPDFMVPAGYDAVLTHLKAQVRAAQMTAYRAANEELLRLSIDRTTARLADNNWAIGFTGRVGPGHEH